MTHAHPISDSEPGAEEQARALLRVICNGCSDADAIAAITAALRQSVASAREERDHWKQAAQHWMDQALAAREKTLSEAEAIAHQEPDEPIDSNSDEFLNGFGLACYRIAGRLAALRGSQQPAQDKPVIRDACKHQWNWQDGKLSCRKCGERPAKALSAESPPRPDPAEEIAASLSGGLAELEPAIAKTLAARDEEIARLKEALEAVEPNNACGVLKIKFGGEFVYFHFGKYRVGKERDERRKLVKAWAAQREAALAGSSPRGEGK